MSTTHRSIVTAGALFVLLVGALVLVVWFLRRPPVLEQVFPQEVTEGSSVILQGRNFGTGSSESYITVAGSRLTSSAVRSWEDEEIQIRMPDYAESGLVRVHTTRGSSEGILLRRTDTAPRATRERVSGGPTVDSVEPFSSGPEQLVRIKGSGFGVHRGGGRVLFDSADGSEFANGNETIAARDRDYAYVSWTDEEIYVFVPEGAVSGSVTVERGDGERAVGSLEVQGAAGAASARDSAAFAVVTRAELRGFVVDTHGAQNELFVWFPVPQEAVAQQTELLRRRADPVVENLYGMSLYQKPDVGENEAYVFRDVFLVRRSEQRLEVDSGSVERAYDENTERFAAYTRAEDHLPVNDSAIAAVYNDHGAQNPYRAARSIYEWIIESFEVHDTGGRETVAEVLEASAGGSFGLSALMVSALRSGGIPSRMVSGVRVDEELNSTEHHWVEVLLPGAGWLPADPALGSGAIGHVEVDEPREYYFGAVDERRVAFSLGTSRATPLHPGSRVEARPSIASAIQPVYDGVSGPVADYEADWRPPVVIGEF